MNIIGYGAALYGVALLYGAVLYQHYINIVGMTTRREAFPIGPQSSSLCF